MAMLLVFAALYGMVFIAFQWQAVVLGHDPLEAALGLAPLGALMIPLGVSSTVLAGRFGTRAMITSSLVVGVVGAALLVWSAHTAAYWTFALAELVFGASAGLGAGPGTEAISSRLPAAQQGIASAINDLSRELGATLGIAMAGTAFNIGYRTAIDDRLTGPGDIVTQVKTSPAIGETIAAHRPPAAAQSIDHAIVSATGRGWATGMLTFGLLLLLGAVAFVRSYPPTPPSSA